MGTAFTDLLALRSPIVQAPMAGVSTAALAGAVSGAGGLGSIAIGALTPADADRAVGDAMAATGGQLNVNVFVHPTPHRDDARERAWLARLQPLFAELGVDPPDALHEIYRSFDDEPAMLDVLLSHRPPVVSLHFGLPCRRSLEALRAAGVVLLATATSAAEARLLADAGIDAIVAQGFEAGGHRGAFAAQPDQRLSTLLLLPRIVAAVDVPVLAAGGITRGLEIDAALRLGASGVQLGTVFAECPESAAGDAYRRALGAADRHTVMTAVFSGRPARGMVNRLTRELAPWERDVPDYPRAYAAAKALAAAAKAAGSADFAAMWAGQGAPRQQPLPAAALLQALDTELAAAREQRAP